MAGKARLLSEVIEKAIVSDGESRYILNWSISNTMRAEWCTQVLEEAIYRHGKPHIFNTD